MQTETNKKWHVGVAKTEYGMQSKKTFGVFFLLENYIFLYKFNLVKDNYIILNFNNTIIISEPACDVRNCLLKYFVTQTRRYSRIMKSLVNKLHTLSHRSYR